MSGSRSQNIEVTCTLGPGVAGSQQGDFCASKSVGSAGVGCRWGWLRIRSMNFSCRSIHLSGGGIRGHHALLDPPPDADVMRCAARVGGGAVLQCHAREFARKRREREWGARVRGGEWNQSNTCLHPRHTHTQMRRSQDEPLRARNSYKGRTDKAGVGAAAKHRNNGFFKLLNPILIPAPLMSTWSRSRHHPCCPYNQSGSPFLGCKHPLF